MEWMEAKASTDNTWNGQEPIEGRYISKREGVGPNSSNMYIVETGEGRVGVWGSTVLDNKMSELRIGCTIKIEFAGLQTGKRGNKYKDYRVFYKEEPYQEAKPADLPGQGTESKDYNFDLDL